MCQRHVGGPFPFEPVLVHHDEPVFLIHLIGDFFCAVLLRLEMDGLLARGLRQFIDARDVEIQPA